MRVALLIAIVLASSGCLKATDLDDQGAPPIGVPTKALHVLDGTSEPTELVAPAFKLIGAVAKGGPVYGAGEPNIWAHHDGTLYIAFAGCDNGPYYIVPTAIPGQAPCAHGPVYKSADRGATWKRLNDKDAGRLAPAGQGPNANGDNDVTVDSEGTIYVSNLGTGIHAQKSTDGGATWQYIGNVVPKTGANQAGQPTYNSDRNWMAAAGPGHLIVTWMGSAPGQPSPQPRAVGINTTFDGGETWTGATYVSQSIGWLGSVQFHPNQMTAYIPFTKGGPTATMGGSREFELHVAVTQDGGRNWTDVDTKVRIQASSQGGHWSGVHMAPALDVTGDGTVVYAWSEEIISPAGLQAVGSRVRAITSKDGLTWSQPATLGLVSGASPPGDPTASRQAILPWVAGGAGDRYAVTFFASPVPGDSDYVPGAWRLEAVVVDGDKQVRTVIDPNVHLGNICTRGGGCQHPVSDRELLDFFESDLMPDGNLVVVYPADDATKGKSIEQRFAIQTGGTPLLLRTQ